LDKEERAYYEEKGQRVNTVKGDFFRMFIGALINKFMLMLDNFFAASNEGSLEIFGRKDMQFDFLKIEKECTSLLDYFA
jgi:peptidoglycan biosynthesis protein MviN/MurJ (putative lipid II flippase)